MVEQKEVQGSSQDKTGAAEQTLSFFDSIFNVVPPVYRQVDNGDVDASVKRSKVKPQKNGKDKKVSLLELNQKAQKRIESIQRANALKSQAKIKELTAEHNKKKSEKQSATPQDPDTIMSGDSDAEESKD